MEKFSKFNDPSSGVNPFLQPKQRAIGLRNYFTFLLFLPLYLLSYVFPFLLPLFFTLKLNRKNFKKIRVGICNSSSHLDRRIIKHVFGISNLYYVRDGRYFEFTEEKNPKEIKKILKPCFLFPEGTRTNNKALLSYEVPTKIDLVCFIKYSNVFVYGSYFKYLISIISHGLTIEIKTKETEDPRELSQLAGVPTVKFNYKDKESFLKELNK